MGSLHRPSYWGRIDIFCSTHVLTDPTSFEEPLLDTTFTVTVDENGGLVSVVQLGLASQDILQRCIATAKARCVELGKRIYASS